MILAAQDVAPWGNHWSVAVAMFGNFFVALSVIFFAIQAKGLKRQTEILADQAESDAKSTQQQLHVQSVSSLQHFFLEMFKDPELASVWELGRKNHEQLNKAELLQFKWACVYWFEHIGAVHRMRAQKLIAESDLQGWEKAIRDDFVNDRKRGLVHFWKELEEDYEDDFKNWVHQIIDGELVCDCAKHKNLGSGD